jgi:hypothetical protein
MKPCDCKDIFTVINELNEGGITINSFGLKLCPNHVFVSTSDCTLILPQNIFKRFAEWYLEDQTKENEKDGKPKSNNAEK